MAKNYIKSTHNNTKRRGDKNILADVVRNSNRNNTSSRRLDSAIRNRDFIFELIDEHSFSQPYLIKLNYESVFNALSVLTDYCVETSVFAKFDEMLEYVAVSPHSLLFDKTEDIADFYYSVEEYVESLCRGFFNSEEDMLNIEIDQKRLSDRKAMVKQYKDITHVLVQWLSVFGKAHRNNQTVLVYADFMTDETLFGV